jgi:dihydroorotate dehydrogenase electron transfer subunit
MRVAEACPDIKPGQFYMLGVDGPLLPRPLSVCEIGPDYAAFCYLVVGAGTAKLSALRPGDKLKLTGPLGNGFDLPEISRYERVAVVSGGIGIAPFVELVKRLNREVTCFCGFSSFAYLTDRLPGARIATENGSAGHKGYVTDIFEPRDFDLVLACGPEGFSRAVIQKCRNAGTPLYISLDNHMACGVGACLVCVCATIDGNKRCCADGPVFRGEELTL